MSLKQFIFKNPFESCCKFLLIANILWQPFSFMYYLKTNIFLFCYINYKSPVTVGLIHTLLLIVSIITLFLSIIDTHKKTKKNKIDIQLIEDNLVLNTIFKKNKSS